MSQKKNWMEALERELRQLPEEDRLGIIFRCLLPSSVIA